PGTGAGRGGAGRASPTSPVVRLRPGPWPSLRCPGQTPCRMPGSRAEAPGHRPHSSPRPRPGPSHRRDTSRVGPPREPPRPEPGVGGPDTAQSGAEPRPSPAHRPRPEGRGLSHRLPPTGERSTRNPTPAPCAPENGVIPGPVRGRPPGSAHGLGPRGAGRGLAGRGGGSRGGAGLGPARGRGPGRPSDWLPRGGGARAAGPPGHVTAPQPSPRRAEPGGAAALPRRRRGRPARAPMARAEYTLRSLGALAGERRRPEADAGGAAGERSLLAGAELERAARRRFQQAETPACVYVAAACSALGGFLFGYDTGVVAGALLPLRRRLRLSALWQELLVSGAAGAAALSALAGGTLNGALGRRAAVLLASALCAAGSALLAAAGDKETLLAGRLVVGLGIGLASMTVPVYIAEVSPPHLRGRLVTANTLFITGGQFFASVVDGAFSGLQRDGWRYMLGLAAIPAAVQFLGFLFLPESPRWLIQKGQTQKARRVLSQMRGSQTIDEEYDSIRSSVEEERKDVGSAGPVICRMLSHPPVRRALAVGCGLQLFQQLAGINTIMYYSATILQMAGVADDRLAIWLASLTAFTNFIFTLVGVWLVEKAGRRKLTLASLAGTTAALLLLALGFLLSARASPHVSFRPEAPLGQNSSCAQYSVCEGCMLDPGCGFCYQLNGSTVSEASCVPVRETTSSEAAWGRRVPATAHADLRALSSRCENETSLAAGGVSWAYNFCPTPFAWTALLGLVLYLVFFAPGMGPMPWTVNSEIYPLWARSTGNACSSGVNWVCNVLVSLTFLHAAERLTYYGAFFLYAGFAALGLAFVYGCLPETKGKTLEDIEGLFAGRLCSCGAADAGEGRYVEYIRVKGSNYHLSDNDASDVE
ncbi:Proton myo-inositol cotransporter, partial [Galemys pyrenaicus]